MKKKIVHKSFTIIFLTLCITLKAQQFEYKANIENIQQSGFHKIKMPYNVLAKMYLQQNDLRIYDEQNKEIGFVWQQQKDNLTQKQLQEFPIVQKQKENDKQTHVIVKNTATSAINNLVLFLQNTEAKRWVNISGSSNANNWFIIKENVLLDDVFVNDDIATVKIVQLPLINYAYLKITFLGENILPANILKAGIFKEKFVVSYYDSLPAPIIHQVDSSDKKTYLYVNFAENFLIDKITLDVEAPKFFKRFFSLYNNKTQQESLLNNTIISASESSYKINSTKTNSLLFVIENQDNSPLKFKAVKAFQIQKYIIAYLEQEKKYHIQFADSFATKPQYDVQYFADSIKQMVETASIGKIEIMKNETQHVVIATKKKNIFIWVTVVLAIAVLAFFTFKMMNEVNKKHKHDSI